MWGKARREMSTEHFTFDVFLNHSAKDKAAVRAVAERLRADGLKVWFDEWVLKPGDSIPAKIEDGLEHSEFGFRISDFGFAKPCMSANAFCSDPDWSGLETGTFPFRDPLNKERRLLPELQRFPDVPIQGSLAQLPGVKRMPALIHCCRWN